MVIMLRSCRRRWRTSALYWWVQYVVEKGKPTRLACISFHPSPDSAFLCTQDTQTHTLGFKRVFHGRSSWQTCFGIQFQTLFVLCLSAWAVMGVCAVSCSWATTTSQYQGNDGYRLYDILIFLNKHGPWIRRCLPWAVVDERLNLSPQPSHSTRSNSIRHCRGRDVLWKSNNIGNRNLCFHKPSIPVPPDRAPHSQAGTLKCVTRPNIFRRPGRGIHSDRPHGPQRPFCLTILFGHFH